MANHKDRPRSLTYKTISGEFVHIGELVRLSEKPWNDEQCTAAALSGLPSNEHPILYARTHDGNVYILDSNDQYNAASAGVALDAYRNYDTNETNQELVIRRIVTLWSSMVFYELEEKFNAKCGGRF